ncbi:hypothetical protein LCGC14_1436360 [marine sediment metagenome]|uniref:Uncharacterized protein n=1 Tax=marine sediment metagenome TaxID=412755 RepID=A0A0F9K895_9ZZZZ
MNEKIKNHLIKYCESKEYGTSDVDLLEVITEANPLWEGKRDRHRWYTMIPTVVCVEGMFLEYNHCDVDGENSNVDDCIGGYKLSDIFEVKPVEKMTTVYEPVKEAESEVENDIDSN